MTAIVVNRQRKVPVKGAALRRAAMAVLRAEEAPADAEVSIAVTDDAEIRDLNRRYLGKNQPTDVLAFPLQSGRHRRKGDPRGGLLGEVVVSAERAATQAGEYGHSVHREMELLVVHGILHLLGYDDKTPRGKRAMEERQTAILERWRPGKRS